MSSPYSSQSQSGYNSNPPADDGSATAANTVFWATIKTKLGDPALTLSQNINTALVSAFAKVMGGGGVTSTAISYQVVAGDQGKLVRASASGITITTPDATVVLSPFVFAVLNNSTGIVTLDGSGTQTIDGNLTISLPAGGGTILFTDGTNWFSTGIQGTLVGKQLRYGDIINGTIVESNGTNAVTFSLKTLAGNDPSAADPVLLCFRDATVATGDYIYRTVTSATTLTISSGSTMGFTSATAGRLWLVLFDDAGTIRLGAINCLSGSSIYPLGQNPIASSTAEGGAGAADSAQVFYTGTAVTSKPYLILGRATYETGLATAGAWNASPTSLVLFGEGSPLPGAIIQSKFNFTGAMATGTSEVPFDDTIPQDTEGDAYLTQAITATSAANVFEIETKANLADAGASGNVLTAALFSDQDGTTNALTAHSQVITQNTALPPFILFWAMLAGTTTATTFSLRAGLGAASTTTFNGVSGARKLGGALNSYMRVFERVG